MGGVDLADKQRLHCNSTIMGLNRWWLKLFFYLLDVGTANALVLYRLAMNGAADKMTIVEFKSKIVMALCINAFPKNVPQSLEPIHELVKLPNNRRNLCAYCSLFKKKTRTRYKCAEPNCNLPLCSIATGKTDVDCFAVCHSNENLRKATIARHRMILLKTNKKYQ
jgi:hypothetical protein